jgi:Tfp pilus assembly protein PilF
MRTWCIALLSSLLVACASAPPPPQPDALFHDEAFAPVARLPEPADLFALNEAMLHFIEHDIALNMRAKGTQQALVEALYTKSQLGLNYDPRSTRTAAQAFDARAGNCLSLVLMTAAFAKHLGLPLSYQSVYVDDSWTRQGDIYFTSGHVNVTLGRRMTDSRVSIESHRELTIDFLPAAELRGQRTLGITEALVVAMYFNNRAAESLAAGALDEAYAWARAAIRYQPAHLSAYNTLGVIYMRRGHPDWAANVYAQVLQREPANASALTNQVHALRALGRSAEAQSLQLRLAQVEPHPPFHFFDLGMAAFQQGRFEAARDLFKREVDRAAYSHEFHFWLAIANLRLGDVNEARRHLTLAKDNSSNSQDQALYATKLDRLRHLRLQ